MPISYSVDSQQRVIFEEWTGDITASDLRTYWQRYLADPEVLAIRRTLVDLRACTIHFSGAELAGLIEIIVLPALGAMKWKTAVVVERPIEFGVSRQYQVFAGRYSQDAIFPDPETALAWLLHQ